MGETGELNLKVGEDYVQRIAQPDHPERAVLELVWNSIDAEAMNISVDLDRDTADAIMNRPGFDAAAV